MSALLYSNKSISVYVHVYIWSIDFVFPGIIKLIGLVSDIFCRVLLYRVLVPSYMKCLILKLVIDYNLTHVHSAIDAYTYVCICFYKKKTKANFKYV